MKKQLFFGLFAAVSMLCAAMFTSCTEDEPKTTATTHVALKKPAALGDGTGLTLVYEVYDKAGTLIEGLSSTKAGAFKASNSENIDLDLIHSQEYTIVLFAYDAACEQVYNIDNGLQDIRINYDEFKKYMNAQRDVCDAYFGRKTIIASPSNNAIDVKLSRPFAQVNFAVSEEDYIYAVTTAKANLLQSQITVSKLATGFNALTGEVTGSIANVAFNLADVDATQTINLDVNGAGEKAYHVLATAFVLPFDESSTGASKVTEHIAFTITTNHNPMVITSENTPICRNFRTNVIGDLVNKTTFAVTVDTTFDGLANTDLGTGEETVKPVVGTGDDGETEYYETISDAVTAGEDSVVLAEGEYDFNGFTNLNASTDMTIVGTSPEDTKINIPTIGVNGASATFENVTIVTSNASYSGIQHVGAVTLKNCIIEGTYWCYSGDKKTTFINCTFKQTDPTIYNVWTYGSDADFIDCEFFCAGKSVLIYHEGDPLSTVTFTNCKFYASAPANDGKAAIEMTSTAYVMGNCPFDVTITNCTAEGFDNGSKSGNPLYNIKDNCGPEYGKLTVDGVAIALPLQP